MKVRIRNEVSTVPFCFIAALPYTPPLPMSHRKKNHYCYPCTLLSIACLACLQPALRCTHSPCRDVNSCCGFRQDKLLAEQYVVADSAKEQYKYFASNDLLFFSPEPSPCMGCEKQIIHRKLITGCRPTTSADHRRIVAGSPRVQSNEAARRRMMEDTFIMIG